MDTRCYERQRRMYAKELHIWSDRHTDGLYCSDNYEGNEFEWHVAWIAWRISECLSVPVKTAVTRKEFNSIMKSYFKYMGHPGWDTDQIILFGHKIILRIEENLSE